MEILENEYERPHVGDRLEQPPPSDERLLARRGLGAAEPEQRPHPVGDPVALALVEWQGSSAARSFSSSCAGESDSSAPTCERTASAIAPKAPPP